MGDENMERWKKDLEDVEAVRAWTRTLRGVGMGWPAASSQQPAAVPALLDASVQVQVDQTPGG